MTNDASIAAREHLRAHREGVLIADGLADKVRFIIDPATARVVLPCTPIVAEGGELVLFIPEEDPTETEELQLLLAATSLNPDRDFACERWRAYHGEPRLTRWIACSVEAARFAGEVVEVEAMNQPSTIASAEASLCRLLNADRARLASVCEAHAGVAPREPLAVGVDDTGFDIRARFGIIRIRFPHRAASPEDAQSMIRTMLEKPA